MALTRSPQKMNPPDFAVSGQGMSPLDQPPTLIVPRSSQGRKPPRLIFGGPYGPNRRRALSADFMQQANWFRAHVSENGEKPQQGVALLEISLAFAAGIADMQETAKSQRVCTANPDDV
jgi:hypothetical protein